MRRHFHVPARELLLEAPEPCPVYPGLALVGLAVTPAGQHHLICTIGVRHRFYLGPDEHTVTRRAGILTAALQAAPNPVGAQTARAAGLWLTTAWDALLDELVATMTRAMPDTP